MRHSKKQQSSRMKVISEINLTPLMDLTFILLITFIITFPLIEQGVLINLPKMSSAPIRDDVTKTVSIDSSGNIHYGNQIVTSSELLSYLEQEFAIEPGLTILIRGDETVSYREIIKALKVVHSAGITSLSLVTQEDN
jgi:biopolymer transport protein TolR